VDEVIATAIGAALVGHGIASIFPPFQWPKERLGITDIDLEQLNNLYFELGQSGQRLPAKTNIRRLIAKAVNCPACCAWWVSLAMAPIFVPLPLVVPCAVMAYVASSIIDRLA